MSQLVTPLREACERYADVVAFVNEGTSTTYGELAALVEQHADSLRSHGIAKGDRIVWCPKNDLETVVDFWAMFSLGAIACPISDKFPENKRPEILQQLRAKWRPASGRPDKHSRAPSDRESASKAEENRDTLSPATVILSSGSTGNPKAIVHNMDAHIASAEGAMARIPLNVADRWMWSLPAYHASGLSVLVRCAVAAATICGRDSLRKVDAKLLASAKVPHLSLVATQLRRLLKEPGFPNPALRAVLVGGSAVPSSLVEEARRRRVPVHTTYGMTEMASQITTSGIVDDPSSSGRLLPYRELKLEESGEILVKGRSLCLGYFRSGVIEAIVDDDGWFHTGDLGRLDGSGLLYVTGRLDNMFISGGENIHPEVIERELLDLTGVKQALVVPKKDAEFGFVPVAFIRGEMPAETEWQQSLRKNLRRFEIPVAVLNWPQHVDIGIKPSRSRFRRIANGEPVDE